MTTNHLDVSRANVVNFVSNVPQTMDSAQHKTCMMNQPLSQTFKKNKFCSYWSVSAHVMSRKTQRRTHLVNRDRLSGHNFDFFYIYIFYLKCVNKRHRLDY
jgi:hypothetical protein